jgi:CheY-like chemotaxis protein
MARVLVVEDSRTQAQQIRLQLEQIPYAVELATDGVQALAVLARGVPDIVLTDLEMPNMNGLELVEGIRRNYAHVPVVLMTAHGSEEIAALALTKGAASYIPKAYLLQELIPTLVRILSLTNASRQRLQAFDCLTTGEFHYVLGNDPALIAPIIGYLDEMLTLLKLCDATQRVRIGVALQEALLNAMYHGNLEVSSSLRQQDETAYHLMAQMRREEAPFKNRRVYLDARVSAGEADYTIRDDGPGFDLATLPDPTDPENLERIGGRGLLLIRTFMDKVYHNDRGNSITLVKHRDA